MAEVPARVVDLCRDNRVAVRTDARGARGGRDRLVEMHACFYDSLDLDSRRVAGFDADVEQRARLRQQGFDRGAVQVVDVFEVAEHRAGRDARALGDVVGARLVDALVKQRDKRVDHRVAVLLPPEPASVDLACLDAVRGIGYCHRSITGFTTTSMCCGVAPEQSTSVPASTSV